jgi:hypothetical protein
MICSFCSLKQQAHARGDCRRTWKRAGCGLLKRMGDPEEMAATTKDLFHKAMKDEGVTL